MESTLQEWMSLRCKAENRKEIMAQGPEKKNRIIKGRKPEKLVFEQRFIQVWHWDWDFQFYFTLTFTSGL